MPYWIDPAFLYSEHDKHSNNIPAAAEKLCDSRFMLFFSSFQNDHEAVIVIIFDEVVPFSSIAIDLRS